MAFYNGLSQDFSAPDDGCPEPLKIKSRDMSWDTSGRALNYTLTWATDKSISCSFPNEHGVRKVQTESKDKIAIDPWIISNLYFGTWSPSIKASDSHI